MKWKLNRWLSYGARKMIIQSNVTVVQPLYSMEMTGNSYLPLQTPCYILDVEELKRSINGFQYALSLNFQKFRVGYSVKTNSTPYCIKKAGDFGAYAEVVSYDEYALALLCGFTPERIIYNGPMKSKETFLEAVECKAVVNVETKRELLWLKELDANRTYEVGLRLNINISRVSEEDADGDNDNSRFGFSDETGEFLDAVNFINGLPNVKLAGLHIHRTAHSRSIRFYERSIAFACSIIKKYNLKIDYLDVGGGYFGIFPDKPTYRQYSDAFFNVLKANSLENVCLIVEPGNALVASCFSFLSEVIDAKQVEKDTWFITTDGSRNDVDPFFRKSGYLDEELYSQSTPTVKKQIISGCTCLEYDRLFTMENKPLLSVGDRILYHNVGAYTMCLTPMFIRYLPDIYAFEDSGYKLVREKWTAGEYVLKSIIK